MSTDPGMKSFQEAFVRNKKELQEEMEVAIGAFKQKIRKREGQAERAAAAAAAAKAASAALVAAPGLAAAAATAAAAASTTTPPAAAGATAASTASTKSLAAGSGAGRPLRCRESPQVHREMAGEVRVGGLVAYVTLSISMLPRGDY